MKSSGCSLNFQDFDARVIRIGKGDKKKNIFRVLNHGPNYAKSHLGNFKLLA